MNIYTDLWIQSGGVSSCAILRHCASCGILWCRRVSLCRRRTNRRVSGR